MSTFFPAGDDMPEGEGRNNIFNPKTLKLMMMSTMWGHEMINDEWEGTLLFPCHIPMHKTE